MRDIESTFVFADLAGYTAATWTHGDDVAARLSIRLVEMARACVGADGEMVKSIGDAVLCRVPAPSDAVTTLGRLWSEADHEEHFPHLRASAHHGKAIEHEGDYYGTTINVAARMAALASPDEILASSDVADAARTGGWIATSTGARTLRNIAEPIELFRIRPSSRAALPIDPICHMRVDPASAIAVQRGNETTYFCSERCAETYRQA